MNNTRDFFEQDLAVDDWVLFGTPMDKGRGFYVGKIVKFNPKKVLVKYDKGARATGQTSETLLYSEEMFKIDEHLMMLYLLKRKV
jgi:hypothetical protein